MGVYIYGLTKRRPYRTTRFGPVLRYTFRERMQGAGYYGQEANAQDNRIASIERNFAPVEGCLVTGWEHIDGTMARERERIERGEFEPWHQGSGAAVYYQPRSAPIWYDCDLVAGQFVGVLKLVRGGSRPTWDIVGDPTHHPWWQSPNGPAQPLVTYSNGFEMRTEMADQLARLIRQVLTERNNFAAPALPTLRDAGLKDRGATWSPEFITWAATQYERTVAVAGSLYRLDARRGHAVTAPPPERLKFLGDIQNWAAGVAEIGDPNWRHPRLLELETINARQGLEGAA